MEEALRQLLMSSSAVTSLCGQRIDFGGSPQGAVNPRVVLWTISDRADMTLDGPSSLSRARVQIDCYGATFLQAKTLSRAIRAVLDGYAGGGFQGVFLDGVRDMREGGSDEADRPYRSSLDFIINFNT